MTRMSDADVEAYIKDAENQWAESVATADPTILKRVLADDFIWTLPDGQRWNRKQTIEDSAAGPGDFLSDHLDEAHVRVFGGFAVTVGSETWTRKAKDGTSCSGRFVWTDTWTERKGKWYILNAEDLIPPTSANPKGCFQGLAN